MLGRIMGADDISGDGEEPPLEWWDRSTHDVRSHRFFTAREWADMATARGQAECLKRLGLLVDHIGEEFISVDRLEIADTPIHVRCVSERGADLGVAIYISVTDTGRVLVGRADRLQEYAEARLGGYKSAQCEVSYRPASSPKGTTMLKTSRRAR